MPDTYITRRGALFLAEEVTYGAGADDPGDYVYLPHEEVSITDLGVGKRDPQEIKQTDTEDPPQPVRQPATVGGKMALHPYRGTWPDFTAMAPAAGPGPHPPGKLLEATLGGYVLGGATTLEAGSTVRIINVTSALGFGPGQLVFCRSATGRPMMGVIDKCVDADPDQLELQFPLPAVPADTGAVMGAENFYKADALTKSYAVQNEGAAAHDVRTWVGSKMQTAKVNAGPADFAVLEYAFQSAKVLPLLEAEVGGSPDPQPYPWPEVSQVLDGGLWLVKATGNPAPNEWELVALTGGSDLDFGVETALLRGIHYTDPNGINDVATLSRKIRAMLKPAWGDNYLHAQFKEAALTPELTQGGHFGLIGFWGVEGGLFGFAIRAGFQAEPPTPADEGGLQVLDAQVGSTDYIGDTATGTPARDVAKDCSFVCGFAAADDT